MFNFLSKLFLNSLNIKHPQLNTWDSVNFGAMGGGIYQNYLDIENHPTLSAIFTKFATDVSQMNIKHIDAENKVLKESTFTKFFNGYVNPVENMIIFLQKIAYRYLVDSNVFIAIGNSSKGVSSLILLDYDNVKMLEHERSGEIFLKYRLQRGNDIILPYKDIIHLKRKCIEGVFGTPMLENIKDIVSLIVTHDKQLKRNLDSSGYIKGIVKVHTKLNPDSLRRYRDNFNAAMSNYTNSIMAVDAATDYIDLTKNNNIKDISLNDKQSDFLENRVFSFFNISPNIVRGNANHDENIKYVENLLIPLAKQLTREFSLKLLNSNDYNKGERILFSCEDMLIGSLKDKVSMTGTLLDKGVITINEARISYGYPKIEDGDMPRVSLNNISLNVADNYQLANSDNKLKGDVKDENKQSAKTK